MWILRELTRTIFDLVTVPGVAIDSFTEESMDMVFEPQRKLWVTQPVAK
jgi:hypothetical protein